MIEAAVVVKSSVDVISTKEVIVVVVPLKVNSASTGYADTRVDVPVITALEEKDSFSVTVTVKVEATHASTALEDSGSVIVTK